MSGPLALVAGPGDSLVERLRAAIRTEFAGSRYTPAPGDAALWGRSCAVRDCLGAEVAGRVPMCQTHRYRWRASGKPDAEAFVDAPQRFFTRGRPIDFAAHGRGRTVRFDGLTEPLGLELRLFVQSRHLDASTLLRTVEYNTIRRLALEAGLCSLLEHLSDPPKEAVAYRNPALLPDCYRDASQRIRSHVAYAMGKAAEVYWPLTLLERDTWSPRDVGLTAFRGQSISFSGIPQLWLRQWVKRWAKYRLETNWKWNTGHSYVSRMLYFSRFLTAAYPQVSSPAQVTRELLLDYVAWVNRLPSTATNRHGLISTVCVLMEDHRLNDWTPQLPPTALLRRGELPKRASRLPKPIDDHVLRQLLDPTNLVRLPEWLRHWIIIANEHGLRSIDLSTLKIDCLGEDRDGHPTLRWFNNKREREVLHPIRDPAVSAAIRRQQALVRLKWPNSTWLFPKLTTNFSGKRPMVYTTVQVAFRRWMAECEIVDRDGHPAHVTLHQFRHTFGTRELNNGVPQHVVQRLLDHDDPKTTTGYAKLTDQTLREEFVKAARFDLDGNLLPALPEDPTADAAWMKEQLNRAKVTLPNGYCTLPLQQKCEVQNACLDCTAYFRTTPAFLPVHRQQADETRRLLARAETNGQFRVAEKNRQLLARLGHLIERLEQHDEG